MPSPAIVFLIAHYFVTPEGAIGFRLPVKSAVMSMPETTVYENDSVVLGKHQIRLAGQSSVVETIPEPAGKKLFSYVHFETCILASDVRHHFAACRLVNDVSHDHSVP